MLLGGTDTEGDVDVTVAILVGGGVVVLLGEAVTGDVDVGVPNDDVGGGGCGGSTRAIGDNGEFSLW